jgi:hypothetical protein
MTSPADDALLQALAALRASAVSIQQPLMVIGGIAVAARGVPRQTIDIDATIGADSLDLTTFMVALGRHGIVARIPNAVDFALQRQVLLLQHEPTGTPLDISLAWLPFEHAALRRATPVDFGGVQIPVVAVDDLIVLKAVAWRDRDRSDIERLLVLHRDTIALDRIREAVSQFYEALDEPERLVEFDALVRRALMHNPQD